VIDEILDIWFGAPGSSDYGRMRKQWFKKNRGFDAMLVERFGDAVARALNGEMLAWAATPFGTLASILLLDQFTRNCFRGTARAFAGDPQALTLARSLISSGAWGSLPTLAHRVFAIMPFEHDETLTSQGESVRLFSALAAESDDPEIQEYLTYARRHADVIERFGRFPHRNAVLGRQTTEAEWVWLKDKGGF
jgi:uncharacterized protein (DUF924 family)